MMTREETVKVLAMLSQFYRDDRKDARSMANAWHLILKDYDYPTAEMAVIEFAKDDRREYASFPAPGLVVGAIEKERGYRLRIFNSAYKNLPYESLDFDLQKRCGKKVYERMLELTEEEMIEKKQVILDTLKPKMAEMMITG